MKTLIAAFLVFALGAGASAQNQIVAENQLPGTPRSVWDLNEPGSPTIEGFTDDISVTHGSTINFKIRTTSNNYRIDIYRLGYYQGNGARLVKTIQVTGTQSQPTPIYNEGTGTVDAGNWAVSASWAVPSNAVSGVYLAKLTRQDVISGENQIPFIIRADESHSDIVLQTSDTTWHAYNGWDGNDCEVTDGTNLYGGNGPGGDSAPGRAFAVSYNRPIATRDRCGWGAETHDFLFGAEYSAIYWLERNGYDVSYITGVDTARYPALLLNHKLFASVGHDEYWSGDQRAAVEAARAAGVHLAFMSGNEVYWKTRWGPSYDPSATPYRTLICYKETRANARIDPADVAPTWTWTGTWRDLRFSPPSDGGKPENALTGTMFMVDSYREDAITVPYPLTLLRFWRNTTVAATAPQQTATLTENILGYEWDSSPDNGFTPPGLIHLSSTAVDVDTFLIDYGSMTDDGTAFHHLTLYKHPTSGAIVFGAGTVFWSWGLAAVADGPPTPADPNIQQAMVNLLADMSIQPTTLQAGLVPAAKSTDATPPVSGVAFPADGAAFTTGQPIAISGAVGDSGGRVAGVEVSVDGGQTWHKATSTSFGLSSTNWVYHWVPVSAGSYSIKARATDDSLNTETPGSGVGVTVTSFGSTLFASTSGPPRMNAIDANAVELGVKFTSSVAGKITGLRFYKNPIDYGLPSRPAHTVHLWSATGALLASATFTIETMSGWQQVNLSDPVTIIPGATYTASYHTNGNYSTGANFFATPHVAGPLTAPSSAESGGNGVYRYGSVVGFPSNSYNAENYWVDVVFLATPGAPVITSATTAEGMVGTPFSYSITASQNPTSFNATGLPAGLSVNTASGVISGTPTAAGAYDVDVSATNAAGSGFATLALTVNTPSPPVITSAFTASAVIGSSFSYTITATRSPTSFNATGLPAGLSINTPTGAISGAPTGTFGTYDVAVSATNSVGTGSATLSITLAAPGLSLFSPGDVPAIVNVNDPNSVELGVKFMSSVAGTITGLRFYKGSLDIGTHTGHLWSATGTLLASATFTNETTSGWQQVNLATPVPIIADTTYIASYHTGGRYSANGNYFASARVNGPLAAPSSAGSAGNGVYRYGSAVAFPSSTYNATNYWVDVVFAETPAAPVITSALTASATIGESFSYTITATKDPTSFNATGLPAGLSVNTSTGVMSGTPTAASGSYDVALSATNSVGTGSATLALTIAASGSSLFSPSDVPAVVSVNDPNSVELGVKFTASVAGTITGFRFYKGPQNTGTHLAHLWSATGTLLASVTFANETASGWQQVNLASPVAITAGTTYVASYHTAGRYSASANYFATARVNGPLAAPSSAGSGGNGVYRYGSAVAFPTSTFNGTNYWVDVILE